MSTVVDANGNIYAINPAQKRIEPVTAEDAKDPAKLARILNLLIEQDAALQAKASLDYVDFEDIDVGTAGATVALNHGLGLVKVRYFVVEWAPSAPWNYGPILFDDATKSDTNKLYLLSYAAGKATVRVSRRGI